MVQRLDGDLNVSVWREGGRAVLASLVRSKSTCLALACAATIVAPVAGHAQEASEFKPSSTLKLELNRLEPAGESCRTYLLIDNKAGSALKSLKVDLYAFDTDGVAQKRLAVELGPIQEKKTMVRLFDFTGLPCPKIGRVLLNDVIACEGADASRESCLERIETTTKASAEFIR